MVSSPRRHLVFVFATLAATLAARAADAMLFRFPRSAPEAQGVSSTALLRLIEESEKKIDALHGIVVVRHGQVILEGWWAPYAADERHQMFSLSKSFTSTAVGLAVAEGKLTVNDTVLSFFPEQAPEKPSANLRAMRVRDLLTMSTGHHSEDIANFPWASEDNLVKKFFALPVAHKPGTLFVYNGTASFMLSAIVQQVTGQTMLDYLRPRLFEPLGIVEPQWDASKQGVTFGNFGLHLRTEDIARFGQLYLQKGQWQGRQLVPAAWVEAATSRQMSNGSNPASDWEQGYGYQFWRCRHGIVRGDGAHGQFCVVLPQHDVVVAITAGTRDLQGVLNFLWESLLPALQEKTLAPDAAAQAKLTTRLAGLVLPTPTGASAAETAKAVAGKRYTLPKNPANLTSLTLRPAASASGEMEFSVGVGSDERKFAASAGTWRKSTMTMGAATEKIATSGAWTSADTYTLKLARYNTPFVTTYRLQFAGDALNLEIEDNVGAGARPTRLTGRAE
ncbi:MAG: beta-lactamase family protein [Verrucomicrobia bacterium]|nr:beta-lactamase family protein [Verrucomicrobiota bacterium]